ncbi:MAG: response regulator transcription factor [Chitinophagaceae bacterium]|nr:response regulator transcription factor [Chitinophagaceae bacterium]
MYKSIIVDDDPLSAGVIAHYCQKTPELALLKQFDNPEEALDFLTKTPSDLIFLDVEMPGLNGFELLDKLDYSPYVILFSSKSQYAYLAFEYNVVDFLKKPVLYPRFKEAIEKLTRFDNKKPMAMSPEEIYIRTEGKLIKIPFHAILYVEVVDDYVKIVTEKGNHLVLCTLKHIEGRLSGHFVKTHRSFIVNTTRIDNLSEGKIHLGNKIIPISKAHKTDILRRLNIL